ncbi:MAG: hypothetical protein PHU12_01480 [Candidatus Aenigmarchaeota archaeon]|nr:hypothetical protein [Candidatus Aenigmarchaeota archaeon]
MGAKVIDFRSRIDRTVYIVGLEPESSTHPHGYAIVSNAGNMQKDGKCVWQNDAARDITVARLTGIVTERDWAGAITSDFGSGFTGVELHHDSIAYGKIKTPVRIRTVGGVIKKNDENSYTLENQTQYVMRSIVHAVKKLEPEMLNLLENFMVPKEDANAIRMYVEALTAKRIIKAKK